MLDYENEFFLIESALGKGFVYRAYVQSDGSVQNELERMKKSFHDQKKVEDERKRKAYLAAQKKKEDEARIAAENAKEARIARIKSKYSSEIAEKILGGYYWIGMTDEMARESLGEPDDINRSVNRWGVHEQWVYRDYDINLYFDDGKCTSYQN